MKSTGIAVLQETCIQREEEILSGQPRNINALCSVQLSALNYACSAKSFACAEFLLEMGASVYFPESPSSPLHDACEQSDVDLAEMLIYYGANINAVDRDNRTPLLTACRWSSNPCVEFLVNLGADVNIAPDNDTVLHTSCIRGFPEYTALLIRAGANLDVNYHNRGTPLYNAAFSCQPLCARILLRAGALVNLAIPVDRDTPLHVAAIEADLEVAKVLIEFGADVYARNDENKTPVDILDEREGELYNLLVQTAAQPVPLKDLCRRKIRSTFGGYRMESLHKLKLPQSLLLYLMHDTI
ncbi:ankyrin repeat and SOCS box protein 5 [Caerostris darwini]|uniref:Ankyrin repeat and SOCS box protein 5 n=1 Tax=Caerostris darwini TaxID=1538125 RepID=A0AAV4VRC3_9ARAC|nr:ankyrin repeat and SOCS box protein 5 [Caerostris darwini]